MEFLECNRPRCKSPALAFETAEAHPDGGWVARYRCTVCDHPRTVYFEAGTFTLETFEGVSVRGEVVQ